MSMIGTVATPAATSREPAGFSRLVRLVAMLRRVRSNRADMRRLRAMADWQLDDIGVTRADVLTASAAAVMEDPTRTLDALHRERRRVEEAARRVC